MTNWYLVLSDAGPRRDPSRGTREQPWWDDHASFIDGLVEDGFILLGGPFADGGAMMVVQAESEAAVKQTLNSDPWYQNGILSLVSIREWQMFINELPAVAR